MIYKFVLPYMYKGILQLFPRVSTCCKIDDNVDKRDDTNLKTGSESEREASEPLLNVETEIHDKEEVNQRQIATKREPKRTICFTMFCCCSKSANENNPTEEQNEERVVESGEGLLPVDTDEVVTGASPNKTSDKDTGEDLMELNVFVGTEEKKQQQKTSMISNKAVTEIVKSSYTTKIDQKKVIFQ